MISRGAMVRATTRRAFLPMETRRPITSAWIAAHPDLAVATCLSTAALAIAAAARVVHLQRVNREAISALNEDRMAQLRSEKRAREDAERRLAEAVAREVRLRDSVTHRGRAGEAVLKNLLDGLPSGCIEGFELQPLLECGRRPDAVVSLAGERDMVIDSKAPEPPHGLLGGDATDSDRQEYVNKLKDHIADLAKKKYHASLSTMCIPRTWLLLPGEGYLRAAYDSKGNDTLGLHTFADQRNVTVVGPNGLRGAIEMWLIQHAEKEDIDKLGRENVQEALQSLQPVWTESVLPGMRKLGNFLKKFVNMYNEVSLKLVMFDKCLRDVLDLPKPRKTMLPPVVKIPSDETLQDTEVELQIEQQSKTKTCS